MKLTSRELKIVLMALRVYKHLDDPIRDGFTPEEVEALCKRFESLENQS